MQESAASRGDRNEYMGSYLIYGTCRSCFDVCTGARNSDSTEATHSKCKNRSENRTMDEWANGSENENATVNGNTTMQARLSTRIAHSRNGTSSVGTSVAAVLEQLLLSAQPLHRIPGTIVIKAKSRIPYRQEKRLVSRLILPSVDPLESF